MQIGFDARMILHSGIGVYARHFLRRLPTVAPEVKVTLLGDPDRIARAKVPGPAAPFHAPIYGPWPFARWPREAHSADLIHCPHYNLPRANPRPAVVTIHDLIHFLGPGELRGLKRWRARQLFESTLRRARAIITISDSTRRELIEVFPSVERDRIHLIRYGIEESFLASGDESADRAWAADIGLPEQFWLTVGIDKPHKNLPRLLARMKFWFEKPGIPQWPLVIIGPNPQEFRQSHASALASLGDRLIVLDPIDPDQMPRLMRCASALLYPTLREGWGFPAMEALASGVPVIGHRVASLPEVVGDVGILLDPEDDEGWFEAMLRVGNEPALREDLGGRGREWVATFRWEDTVRKTVDVYRSAM